MLKETSALIGRNKAKGYLKRKQGRKRELLKRLGGPFSAK